jgi:hypothetical protein
LSPAALRLKAILEKKLELLRNQVTEAYQNRKIPVFNKKKEESSLQS